MDKRITAVLWVGVLTLLTGIIFNVTFLFIIGFTVFFIGEIMDLRNSYTVDYGDSDSDIDWYTDVPDDEDEWVITDSD